MMGSQFWVMGLSILLHLLSLSLVCVGAATNNGAIGANGKVEGTVFIDGNTEIGEIDEDFICATLDWWPPEKCDYGTCSWGHASFLNLDLKNKLLLNAIKAFSPLKLRLGGTLQDKVIYQSKDQGQQCSQFIRNTSEMFGFTQGCLSMKRWDELNAFFKEAGVVVVFGLNALMGRSIQLDGSTSGAWDPSNAASFINYTVDKGYIIHGWELGNELSGNGVGTRVGANQYAADLASLNTILQETYKGNTSKPLVVAPGGFFDAGWFGDFMNKTPNNLDVVTHHIYNLGPGVDDHLIQKILDPSYLDGEADTFRSLQHILKSSSPSAVAWVGEAGGAYNSGRNGVTNAFVFSFWYLDQLAMASSFDTKTYCRQTLIGGNYGLLNTNTYVPNPDYYSALLWHRLMGQKVLSTSFSGPNKVRAYAHCAKQSSGIVLLMINLDGNTTIEAKVRLNSTMSLQHSHGRVKSKATVRLHHHHHHHHSHHHRQHSHFDMKAIETTREEYHLTAKDGDLHSQTMLLNGKALAVDPSGEIPTLVPVKVDSSQPLRIDPFSIAFVHLPSVDLPACRK